MHILVIDDAITARMMIISFLKELGFSNIHSAEDGLKALSLMHEFDDLDLVFVDWNMPYMNGLDVIKTIRANQNYVQTQILMVTTETGMAKIVEALDAGANEYIMKPFTKDILLDKLNILGILTK